MKFIIVLLFFLFPLDANARILFQDPTGKALNEAYEGFSESSLKSLKGADLGAKEYLLGLLYLNGDKEFDVEKSCKKSVSLLSKAWDSGVVDAGYSLATLYYKGACVEKDIKKARALAEKTAEEGYLLSQRMVGRAYWGREWGDLFPKNMDKAIYWLGRAGGSGDSQSAGNLSYIYRGGHGVPKNEKKSFCWISKAAFSKFEKDDFGVSFSLFAKYFENGIGTDVDLVKAYKYYDLGGSAGVEGKQRVAKKMTQEQIDEAIRQSQEWQKEHNVQVGGGFIRRAN
ncbi:tetratricopeptide repeat protein [Salinicola rhizosphaerae]|uniref:Sel1 repeat family protein n=1 Tax=Salinicola rhizosphaerae TaxID=1443141 RepID=A0ABQ3EHY0_9GAMM|nr:tetratricopeptide repeat protein [Salinicola rhizosphaerae]GHB31331.1 hypothetical protein GCM10009038_32790 [Salinicola rhizosphaerae]